MTKRVLHVVTNVAHYADPDESTGLWLSELTHAYDLFEAKGYEQRIVSPKGGLSPLEPRVLKWPLLDASARAWLDSPARMALLSQTARPDEIDGSLFDVIYFTGGHAVMWDFPDDAGLQELARTIWERGGIVASVCHGYAEQGRRLHLGPAGLARPQVQSGRVVRRPADKACASRHGLRLQHSGQAR